MAMKQVDVKGQNSTPLPHQNPLNDLHHKIDTRDYVLDGTWHAFCRRIVFTPKALENHFATQSP